MKASEQTITIIARLAGGDFIVRATFGGSPRRMTQVELDGHRACGVRVERSPRLV